MGNFTPGRKERHAQVRANALTAKNQGKNEEVGVAK